MAVQSFNLLSNVTISNTAVTGNGSFTVYTTDSVNNNNNLTSMRMIIEYADPNPSDFINITAVVECQQNSLWFPISYQFNPFNTIDNGKQRIIILQPNMSTLDTGIDDDIYVGNTVIARISRQQGKVGNPLRVRFVVYENNYGTSNAFQNVKVTLYGELFD